MEVNKKLSALGFLDADIFKEGNAMFQKACPVWQENKFEEKNYELYFRCQVLKQKDICLDIRKQEHEFFLSRTMIIIKYSV